MKTITRLILAGAFALGMAQLAHAQSPYPEAQAPAPYDEAARFSQAELDSMLAPIALYPDSLLSQLLMAATFPRDIAEAAAWSRETRLSGEEAVRAAANQPWDPSVKSLVAFPQVLAMLDEHMEWTERLGDAFMGNPTQVSDTIQVLRGRADQAGNLRSNEQMSVQRDYGNYVIEPATPEVVYVPYYDPRVVYGSWWWPDYAPVWWSPWAGYAWTPGYAFSWGHGVSVGGGFWYSSFDWGRRYVRFHHHRPYYYRGHSRWHRHRWHSDRDHHRNTRGWHSSGYYRGADGRPGGRGDGQRDGRNWQRDGRHWQHDGRNWQRDGRDWQRDGRDGRGGRDGRDGRGGRDGRDGRGIERVPTEQRHAVPPGSRTAERGIERQPSQPLSRGAIAPAAPMPAPALQASQPLQRERVPVARPAPMPQAAPAPAPSAPPAMRERRSVERESRSESNDRSERGAPESRPEPGARGGGNALGRSGGRSDRQ